MKPLPDIWDGEAGPVLRFRLLDGGLPRNLASIAVEVKVRDEDSSTTLATRPGVPVSPKSDGYVDVWLKGLEVDFEGAGRNLSIIPKVYAAVTASGAAAVNALSNPSFDTYTGGSGTADDWLVGGTLGPTVYEVLEDDPAPSVIFGKTQRIYTPSSGSTAFLNQVPTLALAAGDYCSGGAWFRARLDAGASLVGEPGYFMRVLPGGSDTLKVFIAAGDADWHFVTGELQCLAAHATAALQFACYDALGYDVRVDDAYLFNGRWKVFHAEPYSLRVRSRPRPKRPAGNATNNLAGVGGFDYDSNADGIADGWSRTGSGNTYAHEVDPDHLGLDKRGAQKVTLGGSADERLRVLLRGHFKAGETWQAIVYYKNSGAVTGSPANGEFGVVLHTEEFDGPYEESSLAGANFSLASTASYLAKTRTLTLTADRSVLVLDINLRNVSGADVWLDDIYLRRSA